MAKRKFKVGDTVLWDNKRATITSISGGRVRLQTEKAKQLGYDHTVSANITEIRLVREAAETELN